MTNPVFIWDIILFALLLAISVVDLRTQRIPNALNALLVLMGICFGIMASPQGIAPHAIGIIVGFLPLAIFGEIFFRLRGKEGLGLGDAKMFAGSGAWLGWQGLPYTLLVASLAGILFILIFQRSTISGQRIAFGPFIALGTIAVWYFQSFALITPL